MALAVMLIGVTGAIKTTDALIVVISLAIGSVIGEGVNIEKRLEALTLSGEDSVTAYSRMWIITRLQNA